MTRNVGTLDRAIRLVVGALVLGLFGAPVGTALTGNCPLYTLFGFSTCAVRRAR